MTLNQPAHPEPLRFVWTDEDSPKGQKPPEQGAEPRPGDLCPRCRQARMDYDGLLNLVCPRCGYTAGGCFT